jgi:protein phosphatase 1 regulatory subunit 37
MPRSVDLSGVQLTPTAAAILSDVFNIEWGLRKLTLRECDLDDSVCRARSLCRRLLTPEQKLKPVLHALLIPGTLEYLSVASNRRLKPPAFKLIGAYASQVGLVHTSPVRGQVLIPGRQAKSLQFLDLSSTVLDKKAVDYIVVCLTTAPDPGLVSLRLDDCSLRPNGLEALGECPFVRGSTLT